jgi:hypothetical protein
MSFEKFDKHGESFAPRVSIWKNGSLGISAGAFNLYELTDRTFVVLLFDRTHSRVGLRFTHKADDPGTLKMTIRKSGGVIPCKSFLDYYKIDYDVVRQYVLSWSDKRGMFVFDLELPIEDDDLPEYPHGQFVEPVFAALVGFFEKHPEIVMSVSRKALVARKLFSLATHAHLGQRQIADMMETALDDKKARQNKQPLRIHKSDIEQAF